VATECYLCGSNQRNQREGKVRDLPEIAIWQCAGCGLVYLDDVARRDADFYAQSGMHGDAAPPDAQMWLRDGARDDERRYAFLSRAIAGSRVLDFGCGAGGFLARIKSEAACVTGIEPEQRLAQHFADLGIDVRDSVDSLPHGARYDLVTAFHVIEHLSDPRQVLRDLAGLLANQQAELVIEVPASTDALLNLYGSRPFSEFTYWSCHLYLFNHANLQQLAEQAGLRVNFVRQVQRYPVSNHLYWLAKGLPGGHRTWGFLDSPELNRAYEASLAAVGMCDTLMASFSLV